ncbi:protein S40-5-like [Bidens hawaiensis]|uniref:protein S40-5-like n=1 Tax=Bidens hawaiensis TaxID=980011 RepID=UPI00404997BE
MAKGRKLTTTRTHRFFGYSGDHHTADHDGVELREADVWSMVNGTVPSANQQSLTGAWTSRAAVTRRKYAGGLSVAFEDQDKKGMVVHQFSNGGVSPRGRHVASSAPVNVPDWSKIYRVDSVESMRDSDDEMDDRDSDMVPPHEYLARSHRSAAKSVFEGVGRTLKGRDMSRVRDAVWSQTGFDG